MQLLLGSCEKKDSKIKSMWDVGNVRGHKGTQWLVATGPGSTTGKVKDEQRGCGGRGVEPDEQDTIISSVWAGPCGYGHPVSQPKLSQRTKPPPNNYPRHSPDTAARDPKNRIH